MTELDPATELPVWMAGGSDYDKNETYFLDYLDEFGSDDIESQSSVSLGVTAQRFREELIERGLNEPYKVPPNEANLVSSMLNGPGWFSKQDRVHRPALDIDIPAYLVPSKSGDHSHLYLDIILSEEQYGKLLNVLAEVGIINPGVLEMQWNRHKATFLRLPTKRNEQYRLPDDKRQKIINGLGEKRFAEEVSRQMTNTIRSAKDEKARGLLIDELQKRLDELRKDKPEDLTTLDWDKEPLRLDVESPF